MAGKIVPSEPATSMDGAACEAVRGLKAEQDSVLALIWEALDRRFCYVDEPQRAMRRFDVRRQLEGETLAVFERSLRMLHREAWPKTDLKSPEADSLLRRKFVDGIQDLDLQKYLRLHAATDDFATTVSKARHFMDASELARTAKKPAIRTTSTSVNYQTIVDGVMEALELHNQGRMTLPEAVLRLLAARLGFKIRVVNVASQVTRLMVRLAAPGGQVISRHRAIALAPGHGWIDDSKGRRPLALSPSHRDLDGRLVRVVHVFRSHSRKANGHQGKAALAFVPRPREIQATGDRDGVRRQEIVMASHRSSSRTRRNSADGAKAQLTSSLLVLPIRRHPDAVVAMFAATHVAIQISTRKLL